tara:strand:+ start:1806 stop:2072 length:267 start_codon:yes stop_codon:yes gene_type:complete
MAKMKWIYQMVQDGTFDVFKTLYNNALDNNLKSFIFDNREFDLTLAKAIINVGEQASVEYDQHIDQQALEHFKEWSIEHGLNYNNKDL